jgi:hypothetical protein
MRSCCLQPVASTYHLEASSPSAGVGRWKELRGGKHLELELFGERYITSRRGRALISTRCSDGMEAHQLESNRWGRISWSRTAGGASAGVGPLEAYQLESNRWRHISWSRTAGGTSAGVEPLEAHQLESNRWRHIATPQLGSLQLTAAHCSLCVRIASVYGRC